MQTANSSNNNIQYAKANSFKHPQAAVFEYLQTAKRYMIDISIEARKRI
jgi:hypothetical protein